MSNIGILLTFGVLFPPLAVIIWYANTCDFADMREKLSVFDTDVKGVDEDRLMDQLNAKLSKVSHMMRYLLLILIPFVSLFYAFFLFDMTGDAEGAKLAAIPFVIMGVLPTATVCVLLAVRKATVKKPVKHIVDFSAQDGAVEEEQEEVQEEDEEVEDDDNAVVLVHDFDAADCEEEEGDGDIEMSGGGVGSKQSSRRSSLSPSKAGSTQLSSPSTKSGRATPQRASSRAKRTAKAKKEAAEEVAGDVGQTLLSIFMR